jgi:tungstate transport system substrate-binding protein
MGLLLGPSAALAGWQLRISSTTSIDNTGLLAYLLPYFEKNTGIKVDVIAVGTGKALKLAENGDVDAAIVHDPASEEKFMKSGFGGERRTFMKNYFIIAGPAGDPAKVGAAKTSVEAFLKIAASGRQFISRGDNSGTHMKELELWKSAGINYAANGMWYVESGKGMGEALLMADEKQAYILTDEATYLSMKPKIKLAVVFNKKDAGLINLYSIITTSPKRYPKAHNAEAVKLADFLESPQAWTLIRDFKDAGGNALFEPTMGPVVHIQAR